MKKILYLTCFLAIVSAIAGGALAFANQLTAPIIKENNENAEKQVLLEMYPEADVKDFEIMNVTVDNPTVNKIYSYENNYIFNMSVSGYKEGTTFLVAIDKNDGKISAFKAISNGDTKGIGSKITESAFANSIIGKESNGELDTISGATVTSTPVIEGIHEASDIAAEIE